MTRQRLLRPGLALALLSGGLQPAVAQVAPSGPRNSDVERIPHGAVLNAAAEAAPATAPTSGPSTLSSRGVQVSTGAATNPATHPTTNPTATATTHPATVAEAVPLPVPEGAREAIEKLSSAEERERRKAVETLIRMGLAVKPLLAQRIASSPDFETLTRARAALAQIEEDRLIGPSYVTLHVANAEPRAVAAELSRQCFVELKVFPDNVWDDVAAKVTIDVNHEPFWVAMQQFTAQTGLSLQQYNDGYRLMRGGQQLSGPWTAKGAFLAVAQSMTRIQVVQLVAGNAPGQGGAVAAPANGRGDFNLQMIAVAEPKLAVVRNTAGVRVTEAVDDNGNSLLFQGQENRGFYGGQGPFWNLQARLNWPAKNPGKHIARFRALATFTIQTKVQRFEIQDPLHMKERATIVGGVPVTIRPVTRNGDNWEVKFAVSTEQLSGPGWASLQQSLMTRLQLVDEHGLQLEHRGMGSRGQQNEIEFNLPFASGQLAAGRVGDAVTLVWEVPLETRDINVPIVFDDLPMPE